MSMNEKQKKPSDSNQRSQQRNATNQKGSDGTSHEQEESYSADKNGRISQDRGTTSAKYESDRNRQKN